VRAEPPQRQVRLTDEPSGREPRVGEQPAAVVDDVVTPFECRPDRVRPVGVAVAGAGGGAPPSHPSPPTKAGAPPRRRGRPGGPPGRASSTPEGPRGGWRLSGFGPPGQRRCRA